MCRENVFLMTGVRCQRSDWLETIGGGGRRERGALEWGATAFRLASALLKAGRRLVFGWTGTRGKRWQMLKRHLETYCAAFQYGTSIDT